MLLPNYLVVNYYGFCVLLLLSGGRLPTRIQVSHHMLIDQKRGLGLTSLFLWSITKRGVDKNA